MDDHKTKIDYSVIFYLPTFLIVVFVYGSIPFFSIPTLGQIIWASGFAQSFQNDGFSIWANNFGFPSDVPIAFGLSNVVIQSLFIHLMNLHPIDAYSMAVIFWLGVSIWGTTKFSEKLGAGPILSKLCPVLYLTLPIVWWHDRYSMLSLGFALLPTYFFAAMHWFFHDSAKPFNERRWAASGLLLSFMIAIFMDGYTFLMYVVGSFIIIIFKFRSMSAESRVYLKGQMLFWAFCVLSSYVLYVAYLGGETFPASSMDFFRGWGVDVVMWLVPSKGSSWLFDYLEWSQTRSQQEFFGDDSVWMTTFALVYLIVGIAALMVVKDKRWTKMLLAVACVGAYLSLGPSLKINATKPAAVSDQPHHGQMMKSYDAVMSTGSKALYRYAPGFKHTRATYRFMGLFYVGFFGLIVLLLSSSIVLYPVVSILLFTMIFSVNLPNLSVRFYAAQKYYQAAHDIDQQLVTSLSRYIDENERVVFLPMKNDFMVNYLASMGQYYAYNIGGDKNLAIAKQYWPSNLDVSLLMGNRQCLTRHLHHQLNANHWDKLVIPYFDLLIGAHAWPPNDKHVQSLRNQWSNFIHHVSLLDAFNIMDTEFYAVISKTQLVVKAEDSMMSECCLKNCIYRALVEKSQDIGSQIGLYAQNGLMSQGKPGFLLFGPYKAIESGTYQLKIQGEWVKPFGKAIIDVVSNQGKRVHWSTAISDNGYTEGGAEGGTSINQQYQFELQRTVKDLEVRVRVEPNTFMRISSYHLFPK